MSKLKTTVELLKLLAKDEDVVAFLCGKYSDGTNRNISDAVNGEYYSPKQKKKAMDSNKKKGKKKKKKKSTKFKL